VLSELRRREPNPQVQRWVQSRCTSTLYLSTLTLGELRKGIEQLPDAARRHPLQDWLDTELPAFFAGRILSVDAAVAEPWGRIQAQAKRPLAPINSLLAATAVAHNLTLITRNVRDVEGLGVDVLNPWAADR
jgi:predicted nucleic acid-binding protein